MDLWENKMDWLGSRMDLSENTMGWLVNTKG
jgi:hypothetical protein